MRRKSFLLICAWLCLTNAHAAKALAPKSPSSNSLPTGALARLGELRLQHSGARWLVFSPDSKQVASVNPTGQVRIWEVSKGTLTRELDSGLPITCVPSFPSTKAIVLVDREGNAQWRSWQNLKVLDRRKLPQARHVAVGFPDNGPVMLTLQDPDHLVIVDVKTNRRHVINVSARRAGTALGRPVFAVSPDGAIGAYAEKRNVLRLVDLKGRKIGKQALRGESTLTSIAYSPDGKTIACATSGGKAHLYELKTGRARSLVIGHFSPALALSPDGQLLASVDASGAIQLINVKTGAKIEPKGGASPAIRTMAALPNGRVVTAAVDGSIRIWNHKKLGPPREFAKVPRGASCVAASPNGTYLAAAGYDGGLYVWDVASGKQLYCLRKHNRYPKCACFSPDSTLVASGGEEGDVLIWNAKTGREICHLRSPSGDWVNAIAFSPDGKRLAAAHHGAIGRIWSLETQIEICTLKGHVNQLHDVAFSPDGRLLATAGSYDKVIRLWQATNGKMVGVLRGHKGHVFAVAFSTDGQVLYSVGSDGTLRFWEIATQQEFRQHRGHQGRIWALSTSDESKSIATAGDDGVVLVWAMQCRKHPRKPLAKEALAKGWADLASQNATKAYDALDALTSEPRKVVTLLTESLPLKPLAPDQVRKLIQQLDARKYANRVAAFDKLCSQGKNVLPYLRQALKAPVSREQEMRLATLIAATSKARYSGAQLRVLRSIQLLELVENKTAIRILRRLTQATEGDDFIEQQARAALTRATERVNGNNSNE